MAASRLVQGPRGDSLALDMACRACGLCAERTKVVVWRGRLDASVLFVGEAPGAEEDAAGQPFVGRSGQLLDRWIRELGLGDDWCITNVVRCRPPGNRKPKADELEACWPHLQAFLAFVRPRAVVAVGATSAAWLRRQGIDCLAVKHPSYFVRGFGGKSGGWPAEVARLRSDLEAVRAR